MSSLTAYAETAFWSLVFNGAYWPGVAQNDTPANAATQLWVSLHNENPGEGGSQNTFETTYGGYARVPVNRVAGQWVVSGASPVVVMNAQPITFPVCAEYGDTVTYWGVGLAQAGAGSLLLSGPIGGAPPFAFAAPDTSGLLQLPGAGALAPGQPVVVYGLGPLSPLPGGLSESIEYYVGRVTAAGVTLAYSPGNVGPVAVTSPGAGALLPCAPMTVLPAPPSQPSFPALGLAAYLN